LNEAHEGLKKGSSNQHNSRKSRKQHRKEKMERIEKVTLVGIEPPTSRSEGRRLNH
jgi:hypothetical protein